ncbi:MAG: ImmA/IrrE family metallo-endopeptidase, partial [Actinomycetota bacterium]|nr:ImmA/IrrE family metallo-endopeptidase [Actinomycetota bacterium]
EQDLSGLLLPALGEIWVSAREARDWPPRRRFTIAHEVGHWCMHRTDGAVWCRSQVVNPRERDGDRAEKASPPEEREANEFAAALLMPADLLRRRYAQLRRSDSGHRFQLLCEIFGASGAAMSRRLARVV